ncbi:TPA: D-tyrosyl-tRNA(Tyr) deacylase [Candidatus Gastranaerophilales bacterium HUM_9]|nr:MAG TPA: D-tyrosyl-tRNA(Tyr) deacylase [Candidatus Gastranaerophilales bacterium HUM_9]HBX35067.1 D-tyrosyl-tRNA(Tyr) deacylase [Cyanobacteria bacterium UBA11440]
MKGLIQRVKKASVRIDSQLYSQINEGILIFLGVEKGDEKSNADKLAEKLVKLRIFEDENEKMNKSVQDINGSILVVSQFTLAGDCKKGTRPSFDKAELPQKANELYEYFISKLKSMNIPTQTGSFGAMMNVELINDGPVTFMLEF